MGFDFNPGIIHVREPDIRTGTLDAWCVFARVEMVISWSVNGFLLSKFLKTVNLLFITGCGIALQLLIDVVVTEELLW